VQAKKRREAGLKIAVALEALKGGKPLKKIAADHGVHPVQVSAWKRTLHEGLERFFSGNAAARKSRAMEGEIKELRLLAESLQAEHQWMREKLAGLDPEARRGLIDPLSTTLSLRNQCRLLGIARSSLYYRKKPERRENLELMEKIREFASRFPDFGVLRMTRALREAGHAVNPKRVRRLMRKLVLCAAFLQSLPISPFFHHFHRVARLFQHGSRSVWS
jgi:putative transposase